MFIIKDIFVHNYNNFYVNNFPTLFYYIVIQYLLIHQPPLTGIHSLSYSCLQVHSLNVLQLASLNDCMLPKKL